VLSREAGFAEATRDKNSPDIDGWTNGEIGRLAGVSESTVRNYRASLLNSSQGYEEVVRLR
jgi:hypothetical protein